MAWVHTQGDISDPGSVPQLQHQQLGSLGNGVGPLLPLGPRVTAVHVYHEETRGEWYDRYPEGAREVMAFSLKVTTHADAGIYSCECSKQGIWSGFSESLELVVTGEDIRDIVPCVTLYSPFPGLDGHCTGPALSQSQLSGFPFLGVTCGLCSLT